MSEQRPRKTRLDQLLVERGLCDSRTQAQALVLAGKVWSGTERMAKPGRAVPPDLPLAVEQPPRFASRAGEKLEGFLEATGWSPTGATVLDVGASTGGFTDCLLQRGASEVTCVDVGRGQLHDRLRRDPRVTNLERIHAATLATAALPHARYNWVVVDLSFISLRKVLAAVWSRLAPGGSLLLLIKPQFEASRAEADAGRGVIRDPQVRARVRDEVVAWALAHLPGASLEHLHESVLAGTDGNREFLAGFHRAGGDKNA
jgi:23S rRNA (cytidine1920-2'-O)/16S rRNA (cytidine1409-2'-O)-methyltransferase